MAVSGLLLVLVLYLIHVSHLDDALQALFYNPTTHSWLINKKDSFKRLIFYDGIKVVLAIYALSLSGLYLASQFHPKLKIYSRKILVSLLAILLVPGIVALMKSSVHIACPRDVDSYGGAAIHLDIFNCWLLQSNIVSISGCFPAAHASSGFALLALVLFGKTQRQQYSIAAIVLIVGWVMGGYKMAIGDHYLSHTVASMLLSWFLIALLSKTLLVSSVKQKELLLNHTSHSKP